MQLTIQAICEATSGVFAGSLDNQISVNGVSTDSRGDVKGRLFIPIAGPTFDGHNYIQGAFLNGAVCALTEKDLQIEGYPLIKVASTRQALIDLAVYDRSCFTGPVVAITGSAGKTTTKEMIASVLSQKYVTLKTLGNYNNDIGLPLTLLAREGDHEAMVLEMGMNHLGEISVLSKIGKPDICLITNIGDAHIENLGSREGILKAKSEIFEGMRQGGTVILNGDDPLLIGLPKIPHAGRTVYCFKSEEKDIGQYDAKKGNWISASNIRHQGLQGTSCTISWQMEGLAEYPAGKVQIQIPLPGDHMVMNALMSLAVGLELGLPPSEIAAGIKVFTPVGHRMAITQANGMTIVNDVYNASTSSMKASIDMMADSLKESNQRKVCIFGDMLELGEYAEAMHKEVGEYAAVKKMDLLIAIGPLSRYMQQGFNGNAVHFQSKEDFIMEWQNHLKPGDAVLIKASRGMALESVVEAIL